MKRYAVRNSEIEVVTQYDLVVNVQLKSGHSVGFTSSTVSLANRTFELFCEALATPNNITVQCIIQNEEEAAQANGLTDALDAQGFPLNVRTFVCSTTSSPASET